jgi:hypothetical protein
MLTTAEIKQALSARGISLPDFEIESILCLINSMIECLEANYTDECIKNSIMLWSAILIGSSVGARYVTSENAPGPVGRSFGYGAKPWASLYGQLRAIDTAGCSHGIVEPPEGIGSAFISVITGSRCQGCC